VRHDGRVDLIARRQALSDARVAELRSMLPALSAGAYLNTGTAGPLPLPVVEAMQSELATALVRPRSEPEHLERLLALATDGRAALGAMLGCDPDEIALTRSTTEAMTAVTLGIDWRSGDEAVTTTLEHPGALFPLFIARERFGIALRWADVADLDDEGIVGAIGAELSARTRLVSLSHVSFRNGQRLPIREIAELVGGHGALLLVDGAQAFGAIEVDVRDLGCDAYALPGQKWLLGPEGTGGLYCRQGALGELRLSAASYGSVRSYDDRGFVPHSDARRFEFGSRDLGAIAGQIAAITFLSDVVGVAAGAARADALTGEAIAQLGGVPGVTVATPEGRRGTLVTFTIEGVGADAAVAQLATSGFFARSVRELGAIRLSIAFFTTAAEIEGAVAAVARIADAAR
jgi:L-cysteine/cystine lyase